MKFLKRIVLKIIIIIFMIIFLISSHILIQDYKEAEEIETSLEELNKKVISRSIDSKEIKIDWERLKKINNDIIGWIKIKDTNIDYPILRDTEELFYINHSYDKRTNKNGSIFTMEKELFKNNKTIIYGHNMKNNLMFSELQKYMNEKYFRSHQEFNIYTSGKNYVARIFSLYSINVHEEDKNIANLNFKEEVNYYKNKSRFIVNDIGDIEKILKLSTCSYLNSNSSTTNERYYIIAKINEM